MTNHYKLPKAALGRDITVWNVICSRLDRSERGVIRGTPEGCGSGQ